MNFKFLATNRAFFSFAPLTVLVITRFRAKFLRTADCCRKFVSTNFTCTSFKVTLFLAFGGAISVVAAIGGFVFATADSAGKRRFFIGAAHRFNCRVNFLMCVLRDKLKIRNVVVVVIEVAVVNVVTFGNFAVEIRPNETM